MLAGFLALAGTLLSILFWKLKRRAAVADNPLDQNAKRYSQIDQDLARRNSLAATVNANDVLDALDRLQVGKSH